MSRLTDVDRLLEIMEERTKPEFGSDGSKDRYRYMQWVADYHAIKSAPIVDAVEVVRGEWTHRNSCWHTAICSNCNKITMFEEWGKKVIEYDFCPNCGASMKGADDDKPTNDR